MKLARTRDETQGTGLFTIRPVPHAVARDAARTRPRWLSLKASAAKLSAKCRAAFPAGYANSDGLRALQNLNESESHDARTTRNLLFLYRVRILTLVSEYRTNVALPPRWYQPASLVMMNSGFISKRRNRGRSRSML
jgi:hypothetical protein